MRCQPDEDADLVMWVFVGLYAVVGFVLLVLEAMELATGAFHGVWIAVVLLYVGPLTVLFLVRRYRPKPAVQPEEPPRVSELQRRQDALLAELVREVQGTSG